jgi:hypothetical protein
MHRWAISAQDPTLSEKKYEVNWNWSGRRFGKGFRERTAIGRFKGCHDKVKTEKSPLRDEMKVEFERRVAAEKELTDS